MASYAWKAPKWTRAESQPVLYDDYEALLFFCAMLEEARPLLFKRQDQVERLRRTQRTRALADEARALRGLLGRIGKTIEKAKPLFAVLERKYSAHAEYNVLLQKLSDRVIREVLLKGTDEDELAPIYNELLDFNAMTDNAHAMLVEKAGPHEATLIAQGWQKTTDELQALKKILKAPPSWRILNRRAAELVVALRSLWLKTVARVHFRLRQVPRAAPGDVDAGAFVLTELGMRCCVQWVRLLADTDAALEKERGTRAQRADLRARRRRVAQAVERVATEAARYEAYFAAERVNFALNELVCEIEVTLGEKCPGDPRDEAARLLAQLAANTDAQSRRWVTHLRALLAVPRVARTAPEFPDFTPEEGREYDALELALVRVATGAAGGTDQDSGW